MNNRNPGDFDSFCNVINETIALFDGLIDLENKKIRAIARNELDQFDRYMNDEQAFLLQMRGLDHRRERIQDQLNSSGLTFKRMIEKFDSPERETLEALLARLTEKSMEVRDVISRTKKYIEAQLGSITEILEKLEGAGVYDSNGDKGKQPPPARFTPTKA